MKLPKLPNFLGFFTVLAVVATLAAPLVLVVKYPAGAEHIASVSKIMIPWLCALLLVCVFNNGIKSLFASVAAAIGRLKRFGGTGAEFDNQQQDVAPLSAEQIREFTTYIDSIKSETAVESRWAWHFFFGSPPI